MLTWNSANAVRVDKDWTSDTSLSGSQRVTLASTRTFNQTCFNSLGQNITRQVTVTVTDPSCPSSIDYSPKNNPNTVVKGATASAQVDNWPSNVSCDPFWYVKNGAYLSILGANKVIIVDGAKYFAGPDAVVRGIFQGSDEACVQTSIVINNTFRCRPWMVTLTSALEALGVRFPEPPLPRYNIYNTPDVQQTYPPRR